MIGEFDEEELSITPNFESITKLIGVEMASKLSVYMGGRKVYFSPNPPEASLLVKTIGLDSAKKIGNVYAGLEYIIPLSAGKKALVQKCHSDGMSKIQISAMLRISLSTVKRYLNEDNQDHQLSLFE